MIPIEAVIDRAGSTPIRITPVWNTLRFTTAAVGGFAQANFDLPGDPARWKRDIPHLATIRLVLDTFVIWEGQIEDVRLDLGDTPGATVNCFGLQRRLDEISVRRLWSWRNFEWQELSPYLSTSIGNKRVSTVSLVIGAYDLTDPTKVGLQFTGQSVIVAKTDGNYVECLAPEGLTFTRLMGTYVQTTANFGGFLHDYASGWGGAVGFTSSTSIDQALRSNAVGVRLAGYNYSAGDITPTSTDKVQYHTLRLLGTTVTEDASGGFYGGTILRDLIALVPGLSAGIIDAGSDFTIQSLERIVRNTARSVVEEVAGYYTREWAVWEDGRLDWRTVNKDEPEWVVTLSDLQAGSEVTRTVDGLARTIYVLYPDAVDGTAKESSSTATAQSNPYVKQGKTKDVLVSPGFPMTSTTSGQLASRFVGDVGNYPSVQGRLVLPALIPVKRANGPSLPALQIRGGDNILVSDMPKTDLFTTGRDGETVFHVVSTEADCGTGLVTLEIEGQTRRMDVLLARLAAATRVVGG